MSATHQTSHFECLGLPRRFAIDLAAMEREYLSRSRELHPDFHQLGADSERRASLELSSALNEAYGVLRDSFKRADYLLMLQGGPSAAELKGMPPAFLMEMLEIREEIEALRSSPCDARLAELGEQLTARRDAVMAEVGPLFDNNELRTIRERLNAVKYLNGLIRDLHADGSGT